MRRLITALLIILLISTASAQFNLYLENQITVDSDEITIMKISPNGRFLAFSDKRGNLGIWDIKAGRHIHQIQSGHKSVSALVFDQQNQQLISGGKDGKIRVWDLYTGSEQLMINDFRSPVYSLSLSPDDRFLAAAGKRDDVYIWEYPLGTLKGKLKGHKKDVLAVAFSIGGDQLLSVGKDRQMIVWDINKLASVRKTAMEARTMKHSGIEIKSAALSFDRKFAGIGIQEHILAKGGRSMIFKYNLSFYDWETGSEIETLTGNRQDITFFAITPDKKYAVTDNSTLQKKQLSFWNIQNGVIEQNYPIDGPITALTVSKDGNWLAVGYQDNRDKYKSYINIWKLSGIGGYERFASGKSLPSTEKRGFGASIKLTTPAEPLIQYGQRRRLAVMSFDSPGLEENVARTATYLLESKLGNSPLVELVERNQIQKVLDELQYQQSGLTADNAVQVGQHLNAEYMLIGSINKLGNLIIITSKLVNVETAQIEGTREVQCSNATIETISEMVSILGPTIAKY
ncbi:MAG: CsgG/HfaB family protein [bacterium]